MVTAVILDASSRAADRLITSVFRITDRTQMSTDRNPSDDDGFEVWLVGDGVHTMYRACTTVRYDSKLT